MLLSIVFSFRNEAQVLDELINRVQSTLRPRGIAYEMIFVNDDSTDRSLEILTQRRLTDDGIKVINMSRRFGIHPCAIAGFTFATGDAVVYMDADLQDPPEIIPQLIEKWRDGADVVNTVRTKRLGESQFKLWLTKKAYQLLNAVSDIDLPVNAGDFKLLSRRVVDEIVRMNEHDPFIRGLVRWVGFRQDTVYYTREARFAGKTHFSMFGTGPSKEFIRGLTSFSAAPLYVALILGLAVSLLSFIAIVYVLIGWISGVNVPGWTGIMLATLFLGGMILLTNGFLGMYIGKIFDQIRSRPHFIVKNAIGLPEDQVALSDRQGQSRSR